MIAPIETNNNETSEDKQVDGRGTAKHGYRKMDGCVATPIQRFYSGEKVLITGGTGFLGKILTEKLLRSCSDVSTIYLLVRSKKGKSAQCRTEDLFEERIYERLKMEVPQFRDKIVTVNGDCGVEGLGLSETDRGVLLRNVSIVFHLAASVRFDETIKSATATNVRSTVEIVDLCKRMANLKSFVHVSTVYANCHTNPVEERFYDYPITYEDLLVMADALPESLLEEATSGIVGRWPNTYTFTKAVAETIIRDRNDALPIGIFRPAIAALGILWKVFVSVGIFFLTLLGRTVLFGCALLYTLLAVVSTAYEPLAGWIDNLYGPTGVVAAGANGVLKILRCDPNVVANIVPVDVTVNALIASAWDVFVQTERRGPDMLIYNYVSSIEAPLTWREFSRASLAYVDLYPFNSCVWYRSFTMVKSKTLYSIAMLLLHLLPALLIDIASLCVARKPRMLKMYEKIHKFSNVISYFCVNEWIFSDDNVRAMWLRLNEGDRQLFRFSMRGFDWQAYFHDYVLGIRTYLLKENIENLATSRARASRLYWLHQTVKTFLLLAIVWATWYSFAVVFF